MIVSDSDPTLAWNAYGGAKHGTDITLVSGCQPHLTDCTWTVRNDGLIVSNTNPHLAVNAYGGVHHGAPLRLVNNCAPELDGCAWWGSESAGWPSPGTSSMLYSAETTREFAINAYGGARHGTELHLVRNCPIGNTDCMWRFRSDGMIISESRAALAWNAYGGARVGAKITLVNGCPSNNTDCQWDVLPNGLIVSRSNPALAVKALGGPGHVVPLILADDCTTTMAGCKWITQSHTLKDVTIPISPATKPADTLLFIDPKDTDKKYWLPRYRLRHAGARYEIVHALEADGLFTIKFGLETFPASELRAETAQILPHSPRMEIRYHAANTNIQKQLPAASVTADAHGYVLTLKLTLEERDSLLRAFRSDDAQTELVVMRTINVAVPLPRIGPPQHNLGRGSTVAVVSSLDPSSIYQDHAANLEWPIPLRFDQAEHPYLFPEGMSTATIPEFERIMLRYPANSPTGRLYAYFRDVMRPNRFYFLPDSFKLARNGKPPFTPALVYRVDRSEAGTTEVELTCEIRPHTDNGRLLAAKADLRAHMRLQVGVDAPEPMLEPLIAHGKLRLGLPRGESVQMVDAVAQVDLANGFRFTERFSISEFQDVFASMSSPSLSSILHGTVVVSTRLAADDLVPVDIRFADMKGEIFLYSKKFGDSPGTLEVTLRNATESKLRIDQLPVSIQQADKLVEARIEGTDLAWPLELLPDAKVSFIVHPSQPLSNDRVQDVIFDTSSVITIPDTEKLVHLTLDPTVMQDTERKITVWTDADQLANTTPPDHALESILVEFSNNRQVKLDSLNLQAEVKVAVPLANILLPKQTESIYQFRQTLFYKSGRQKKDSQWRETKSELLRVPVE